MHSVKYKGLNLAYNHLHDLAAIIECAVLDVYNLRYITRGSVVVDLGAGIGEFAIMASNLVGNEGNVIAIEPSPEDYKTLIYNINQNHCDNIIPLNVAVSDNEGKLQLEFQGQKFTADSKPLKKIINELNISIDRIKFIKMDIEGGEKFVIPSTLDIIKNLDFLAMEIHGGYAKELIPLMKEYGFIFNKVTWDHYLSRVLINTITKPISTISLYRKFWETGEKSKIKKIMNRIEISREDDLVVGVFRKNKSY